MNVNEQIAKMKEIIHKQDIVLAKKETLMQLRMFIADDDYELIEPTITSMIKDLDLEFNKLVIDFRSIENGN